MILIRAIVYSERSGQTEVSAYYLVGKTANYAKSVNKYLETVNKYSELTG